MASQISWVEIYDTKKGLENADTLSQVKYDFKEENDKSISPLFEREMEDKWLSKRTQEHAKSEMGVFILKIVIAMISGFYHWNLYL